jgi:hypothetical protein
MRVIGLAVLVAVSPFVACSATRLDQGILDLGTNQSAFVDVWGLPDRQQVRTSEEFASASAGWGTSGGSFRFAKGKAPLDVWVYESRKTELVFDTKKRLVAFRTDLSREELKATYMQKK